MSADLTRGQCTHLIALSADTPKFRAAERWGPEVVRTVRREWLTQCLEKGGASWRRRCVGPCPLVTSLSLTHVVRFALVRCCGLISESEAQNTHKPRFVICTIAQPTAEYVDDTPFLLITEPSEPSGAGGGGGGGGGNGGGRGNSGEDGGRGARGEERGASAAFSALCSVLLLAPYTSACPLLSCPLGFSRFSRSAHQ